VLLIKVSIKEYAFRFFHFLALQLSRSSVWLSLLFPLFVVQFLETYLNISIHSSAKMDSSTLPNGLVSYGPNTNCTIALCPIDQSALSYRPSLAASGIFITLFAVVTIIHIVGGVRWKAWGFMVAMVLGCLDEIVGYLGRILLYYNPFSFGGFLLNQSKTI